MDFQYLLILIFVFWVLEGLAKAKQRGRQAEEQEEPVGMEELPQAERRPDAPMRRPPTAPDEAAEPRGRPVPRAPKAPRNLWEEIQEIARQQQEMDRQRRQQQEAERRPRPQPTQRPRAAEATVSSEGASSEREAAGRPEAGFADDERHSDRWTSGTTREAEPAPARPAPPVPTTPATLTPAARKGAPVRAPKPVSVTVRPARASLRERGAEPPGPAKAAAARTTRALDPLALPRLSREELRRLLMLQEILGPPVSLREEPPGEGG